MAGFGKLALCNLIVGKQGSKAARRIPGADLLVESGQQGFDGLLQVFLLAVKLARLVAPHVEGGDHDNYKSGQQ